MTIAIILGVVAVATFLIVDDNWQAIAAREASLAGWGSYQ